MTETFSSRRYMRDLKLPFCPGCGLFSLSDTFLKAVYELGNENLDKFCFASGIGCSSWIPSPYFLADSIHTLHGRSIPVATSIKLVRPNLNVVVFGGDGDIVGIGLSHFIHAARRNTDILVIMGNNMVYGMTGGQVAPTTPFKTRTTTTPYGSFEHPLDAAKLAVAAGAAYSARWTTAHPTELKESIKKALQTARLQVHRSRNPMSNSLRQKSRVQRHRRDAQILQRKRGARRKSRENERRRTGKENRRRRIRE